MSLIKLLILESLKKNRSKLIKESIYTYGLDIDKTDNEKESYLKTLDPLPLGRYSFKKNKLYVKNKNNEQKKATLIKDFLIQNPRPTDDQIIELMKTMPDYKIYQDLLMHDVDPQQDKVYKRMLNDYEKDFTSLFLKVQGSMEDTSLKNNPLEKIANTIAYLYLDTFIDVLGLKYFNLKRFLDFIVDVPLDGIKVKIDGVKYDITDIIDDDDFVNIYRILIRKGFVVASVDKRDKEIRKFRTLLQKFMNAYKEAVKRGEQKKPFDYNTTSFEKVLEWFEKKYGFTTEFPHTLEKYYERNKSKFN